MFIVCVDTPTMSELFHNKQKCNANKDSSLWYLMFSD